MIKGENRLTEAHDCRRQSAKRVMRRKSIIEIQHKGKRCWLWQGRRTRGGYGRIKVQGHDIAVHRLIWEENYGPIPAGFEIHHVCENGLCVRPTHLQLRRHRKHMGRHARPISVKERRARWRIESKRRYYTKKADGFRKLKNGEWKQVRKGGSRDGTLLTNH
jgi:HNH endonuclease